MSAGQELPKFGHGRKGTNGLHGTPSFIPNTAHCIFNYDFRQSWTGRDTNNNQYVVYANIYNFEPVDVTFLPGLSQTEIFNFHLDMYQYYRCTKIRAEFIPRYRTGEAALAYCMNQNAVLNSAAGTSTLASGSQVVENLFCEEAALTVITDLDDTVVRQNSLDEYYMVRAHPQAVTKPLKSGIIMEWVPTMYDATLHIYGTEGMGEGNPQQTSNLQGTYQVPLTNNAGSAQLDMVVPIAMPWMPTKISNSNQPTGTSAAFNTTQTLFGMKSYIYTPFNTSQATSTETAGLWNITMEFDFKELEHRPFLATGTGISLRQNHIQTKDINVIRNLKGESHLLDYRKGEPEFSNKRKKQQAIAEKEEPFGTDPVPIGETDEQFLKKIKASANPQTAGPSQGTQSARADRTLLDRLGSKRT